jgi:excisionase family DNA binding protein
MPSPRSRRAAALAAAPPAPSAKPAPGVPLALSSPLVMPGAVTQVEPIAVSVLDAMRATGLSKSTIYALIQHGDLPTVMVGRRTLILLEDLRECLRCRRVTSAARTAAE